MNKLSLITIGQALTILFSGSSAVAQHNADETSAQLCSGFLQSSLETQALDLMDKLGLKDGETDMPSIGLVRRWHLSTITKAPNGVQLLVMRIGSYFDGEKVPSEISREFDVVGLKDGHVVRFEDAVDIPDRVVATVAHQNYEIFAVQNPVLKDKVYYVEFTDRSSVVAALKSVYTGSRYWGFSGLVVKGKAAFDPTPERIWKIVDANFDLRRGQTAEVGDIQSYHLDSDFEGYTIEAVKQVTSTGDIGVWVAPWGQSSVIEIVEP